MYKAMSLFLPKIVVKRQLGPDWFDLNIRHHLIEVFENIEKSFQSPTNFTKETENSPHGESSPGKNSFKQKLPLKII